MYEFKKMYLKLITLIVVLVSLIFILISAYICTEQSRINNQYMSEKINKVEDDITRGLINIATVAVSEAEDDDFRRYLLTDEENKDGYEFKIKQRIVNDEFLIYKDKNKYIKTISILGVDGKVVESSKQSYMQKQASDIDMEFVENSKTNGYVYGVDSTMKSLSIIVPIYNKSSSEVLGYYIKEIEIEYIMEILRGINKGSDYESFLVLANKNIITQSDGIVNYLNKFASIEEYLKVRNQNAIDGTCIVDSEDKNYKVYSKRLDNTSMDVVYSHPKGIFNQGIVRTIVILFIICSIIAILAIYFSRKIINLLKKDLEDIKEIIYNYESASKNNGYERSKCNSHKEDNLGLIAREVLNIVKRFEQDKKNYNYSLERTNLLTTEYDLKNKEIKINKKLWERFYGECKNLSYDEALSIFTCSIHKDDRDIYVNRLGIARSTMEDLINSEFRLRDKSGKYRWVRENIVLIRDEYGQITKEITSIKDIDLEKEREIIMKAKSERDSLTGYYNKHHTREYIEQYIQTGNKGGVFILIDLDNFKSINDTFGHQIGDKVLRDLTCGIRKIFRKEDIFGRIGGDEFVIFIKGDSIKRLISKKLISLNKALSNEFEIDSIMNHVSASIGVAFYPEHATTYDDLYNASDRAMYYTKENGKDGYTIYNSNIKNKVQKQTDIFNRIEQIKEEIRKDLFRDILFNPIQSLHNNKVKSYLVHFDKIKLKYNGKEEAYTAKEIYEVLYKNNLERESANIVVDSMFKIADEVIYHIEPGVQVNIPLAFKYLDYCVLLDMVKYSCSKYSLTTKRVCIFFTSEYLNNLGSNAHKLISSLKEYGFKIGVLDIDGEYINIKTIIQYDICEYLNVNLDFNSAMENGRSISLIRETIEFCNKLKVEVSIKDANEYSREALSDLDVNYYNSRDVLTFKDISGK